MLTMSFDPDFDLILSAYETEDEIGMVLRCHLTVEGQIERLIKHSSRAKVGDKTPYAGKVNLMRAMAVPEGICVACSKLNDIRNLFAHEPKTSLADSVKICDGFLEAVASISPVLLKLHGTLGFETREVQHKFTYSDANLGQRIVLASALLSSTIGILPSLFNFGKPTRLAQMAGLNL